ncbi:hypothetical protein [Paraburkholderia lycopersici]|uniref:Uncharacterized protein n=1 Tax=Paraburkholderia lycopersici TaxID=416944 RepID=A0A1G7D0P2_9BURK|nr:hypothetical protein [Paraburkholderia lycopersici]SDE45089.1 hypothetical protein SAMN05421548_15015 [Paraburkholderia lycopersici]
MKPRHSFIPALVSLTLAASSGLALAQGSGGGAGSTGTSPGGATGGASDAYPAQSAEQNPSGTGTTHKSTTHHTKHVNKQKQMNDTTNTPGADASSDTKGQ